MLRPVLSLMLLPVTLLLACEPPPPPVPGVIARTGETISTVNGQIVTQGMVDATLEQLPPATRDQIKAKGQMDQVKEQVVIGEILYQEALKQKLHEGEKGKTALAMAERDALARALLEKVVDERSNDAAVQKYYDEHAVQFKRPEVRARHILVKDKAEADAIFAQVKGGGDFAKLAMEKSVDTGSGKEGGELGWFEKSRMVPEFADAAFAAKKGDTIGPVATKFGFHIIEIEDVREAKPLEDVKEQIKQKLRGEVVQAYIDELKKAATITEAEGGSGGASVTESAPMGGPGGMPAMKMESKPAAPPAGGKPEAAPH